MKSDQAAALKAARTEVEALRRALTAIPQKNFYKADRYDTYNELVLHLWDEETEQSWDIRMSRAVIDAAAREATDHVG